MIAGGFALWLKPSWFYGNYARREELLKRWIAIALIGIGAVVIGLALGGVLYNNWLLANPGKAPVPAQLAGIQQADSTFGAAAVLEIERLHNQDFDMTRGATASFGPDHAIRLWVGGTLVPFQARRVLDAMQSSIESGRFPFVPQGSLELGGTTVYTLDGPDQLHFFFQRGAYVIWLAADPNLAEQALQDVLEYYQ